MKKNKSKIYGLLLGLIMVFAFCVRLTNITWSLDKDLGNWTSYPDEPYGYAAAFNFKPLSGEFRTSNWALIKGTFYYEVVGTVNDALEVSGFEDLIFGSSNSENSVHNNYLLGRFISLCFSMMIIFLIYLFCVKLFDNQKIGLLAAFTYAIFAHEIPWATLITGDILATLLALATVYLSILSYRAKSRKYLFWAAVIAGLAVGTKYSLIALAVPVALSLFLSNFKTWKSFDYLKVFNYGAGLILCFFVGLFIAVPDIIFHNGDFMQGLEAQKRYQTGEFLDGVNQLPRFIFYFTNIMHHGIGLVLTILCLLGIVYFAWNQRRKKETWIIFSFILFYYLEISLATWITTRYALILMPFLAILIGFMLVDLYKKISWKKSFVTVVLLLYIYNLAFFYNFIDMVLQPIAQEQFDRYQRENLNLSKDNPDIVFVLGYEDLFTYPVKTDFAARGLLLKEIEANPKIDVPGKYLLISSFYLRNARRVEDKSMITFMDRLESGKEFKQIKVFEKVPEFGNFFGKNIFYSNDLEIFFQKYYLYEKV